MSLTASFRRQIPLLCSFALFSALSSAQLTNLHDFNCSTEGCRPSYPSVLAEGLDGNLYGTTPKGGTQSRGTVFRVTPSGVLTTLYNFSGLDGANPEGGVLLGPDGNFYGTTSAGGLHTRADGSGGYGTVFRVTSSGALTVMHKFKSGEGRKPFGAPTLGPDGFLYGVTSRGPLNAGVAYRMSLSGQFQKIGPTGVLRQPLAPLLLGLDGRLYGTTSLGGTQGLGTVFSLSTSGVIQTVYNFDRQHGERPTGGLVQDVAGNLYGTTDVGGSAGGGVVFKVTPQGLIQVLHNFDDVNRANGARPFAGLVWNAGILYGATPLGGTQSVGVLFSITTDGMYSLASSFSQSSGTTPLATPTTHSNGVIYGLSSAGGAFGGGSFYSFTPAP